MGALHFRAVTTTPGPWTWFLNTDGVYSITGSSVVTAVGPNGTMFGSIVSRMGTEFVARACDSSESSAWHEPFHAQKTIHVHAIAESNGVLFGIARTGVVLPPTPVDYKRLVYRPADLSKSDWQDDLGYLSQMGGSADARDIAADDEYLYIVDDQQVYRRPARTTFSRLKPWGPAVQDGKTVATICIYGDSIFGLAREDVTSCDAPIALRVRDKTTRNAPWSADIESTGCGLSLAVCGNQLIVLTGPIGGPYHPPGNPNWPCRP